MFRWIEDIMKKIPEKVFDNIAHSYYASTPKLPEQFITLIKDTFHLKSTDSIIDLGCGSGDLAIALSNYSSFVEGIDESKVMIEMAKEKYVQKKIKWICKPIEDKVLNKEQYNLIISFEAFHLFQNTAELTKKCMEALKQNGSLCIGWATYQWEIPLQEIITRILNRYDIPWDYSWTCPDFPKEIHQLNLSTVQKKNVSIQASTPLTTIIDYLFSVNYTAKLDTKLKMIIAKELLEEFIKIYPSGKSIGRSTYRIMYTTLN